MFPNIHISFDKSSLKKSYNLYELISEPQSDLVINVKLLRFKTLFSAILGGSNWCTGISFNG